MELLEAIATTRAIRRYRPDPIPTEDLATMFFAATRAPSGSNRQPFRFVVLRDGSGAVAAKQLLGAAFRAGWAAKVDSDGYAEGSGHTPDSPKSRMRDTMQQFVDRFEETPVVVLACLQRYRAPTPSEGGSVFPAVQNLLLAARSLGYGGVITMWHESVERELKEVLGIPVEVTISAVIPLGRPQGGHGPVRRRPMAEVVFEDGWDTPAPWAVDLGGVSFAQAGPPPAAPHSLRPVPDPSEPGDGEPV